MHGINHIAKCKIIDNLTLTLTKPFKQMELVIYVATYTLFNYLIMEWVKYFYLIAKPSIVT